MRCVVVRVGWCVDGVGVLWVCVSCVFVPCCVLDCDVWYFIIMYTPFIYHRHSHPHTDLHIPPHHPHKQSFPQEHIRMADQFVEVPGGTNINNYANVRRIVATAQRTQVDAVWPGW